MRRLLSSTTLASLFAASLFIALPAVTANAQVPAGAGNTTPQGGSSSQMPGGPQGAGPMPMTQPQVGAGGMSTTPSQRPGTAAGAMGATQGPAAAQGMGHGQMQQGRPGNDGGQSATMQESQVRDLLRNQGYTDVQGISRDGNNYRARAMQGGRSVDVSIDAHTGTIRNQSATR